MLQNAAINSQSFSAALLPSARRIPALTRIVRGRSCTNLHHPLLLPSVLWSHCMRGPEHQPSRGLQLMGSSVSGLKPLMGKGEPVRSNCLSFCQQAWTFLSLLPALISSRKSKSPTGNTSNIIIRLPRVPCKSWLCVRD